MTRDQFIERNPIAIVLEQRGVRVIGGGEQRSCRCPFHEDKTASMSLNVVKGVWNCHVGCGGGSVIDLLAKFDGVSPIDVLKRSGVNGNGHKEAISTPDPSKFETVCTYDYHNALGVMVYQVVRQHAPSKEKPCGYTKTFRQRRPGPSGAWIWDMEGIERTLYRLPEILKSKTVVVVEGEKDAETLVAMGFCSTCNVGGAGKWLEGYTESLSKRHVVLCGDNDDTGQKHMQTVFDSVAGKAKTVRWVKVPSEFKDVTDYISGFSDKESGKRAVQQLFESAIPFVKGVSLPVYRVSELEPLYQRHVASLGQSAFELGKWLPGLTRLRSLVPGELALILGATGIGKTAALSNLALAASPLPTLFFELELPAELMYERLVSLKTKMSCKDVENAYKTGDALGEEMLDKTLSNIYICTQPRLSVQDLERLIVKSELKIGERPKLVLVDYIGLVQSVGKSRYERVSQVAEDLKVMAKATQTVVIASSQVSRKGDDSPEVSISDGKDSGCLSRDTTMLLTDSGFQEHHERQMNTVTLKTGVPCVKTSSPKDSGVKECLRITMRSGRFLDCTGDHKIMTDRGWVRADKITDEHAIAICRTAPAPKQTQQINESRLLGWMLGDGCMRGKCPHFTSADPVLSGEFVAEVKRVFGLTIKRRQLHPSKAHDEFYITTGPIRVSGGNPFKNWLRDIGAWGCLAHEKRIPAWFLERADNNSIAQIVGGLIDTDGCVRAGRRGRTNVKLSTTSEGMAWDFVYCLARLGIFSRMCSPELKPNPNVNRLAGKQIYSRRPLYSVIVDDSREVQKLSKIVRLTTRKQSRLSGFQRARKPSNLGDNLGDWVWRELAQCAKRDQVAGRMFMMARCQNRRISHEKLKKVLALLKTPPKDICELVNPNIYWDRLDSKSKIGKREVFDRSVSPDTPNFVANGIVVHNSLENSSGVVIGLWRDGRDPTLMHLKVLKSTKGGAGTKLELNYNLGTLAITERSKFDDNSYKTSQIHPDA